MRRLAIGIAVAALGLASTGLARAADLPVKAAPVVAPVYVWNGCYLGLNVGYGWARARTTVVGGGTAVSGSENLDGVLGGGQIGCNWQWSSNFVLGVEADLQATGQDHTTTVGVPGTVVSIKNELPWFGTVRGRLGYAANTWLFYVTGGLGYGQARSSVAFAGAVAGTLSASETRGMWVIGAGIENAINLNWSWKLEYLYLSTGNVNSSGVIAGTAFASSTKVTDNVLRI